MPRAVLKRVLVDKPIKVLCQGTGDCGRAPGAWTSGEAVYPLMGKAMDPFPQGRIRKVQRVRDRLQALAFDDLAHGLRPTEDVGFLGLFEKSL